MRCFCQNLTFDETNTLNKHDWFSISDGLNLDDKSDLFIRTIEQVANEVFEPQEKNLNIQVY